MLLTLLIKNEEEDEEEEESGHRKVESNLSSIFIHHKVDL